MLKKCTKREGKAESKRAKMFDRNSNVCEEMCLLFHAQRASVFALLTWVHKCNGRRKPEHSIKLGKFTEPMPFVHWRNEIPSAHTTARAGQGSHAVLCSGFSKILLNPVNDCRLS